MNEIVKDAAIDKLFSVKDKVVMVVGAGGLGDFAVRYGHDRNMADVTDATVAVLVAIVCIIEFIGGRVVKKNTH